MAKETDLIEFLRLAGKLKYIERTGWVNNKIDKPESVADHSWRTAVMAMVIAERQGLDVEKAMKMALVHDIAESEIGDYALHEIAHEEKAEKERAAMRDILAKLGKQGEELYRLWMEFEERSSPEGELVRTLDKLEMVLQAAEYEERQGVDLQEFLKHFVRYEATKLPPDLQVLYKRILSTRKKPDGVK